jgi:Domain of unknown function (DUF1961)/Concanavalin A-like lectin/glucanases superfamily
MTTLPTARLHLQPTEAPAALRHGAPARVIEFDGRAGLNFTGSRGRLAIPEHTVAQPQGSLTLWVAALDDVDAAPHHAHHARSNPRADTFALLSDREALPEVEVAHFALYYQTWWHPGFIAKWGRGSYLDASFSLQQRPTAATGHFAFQRGHWYQLALTWDRPAGHYQMYANGVLIASHDIMAPRLHDDPCGPTLYLGNPAFAFSDLAFYDTVLDPEAVRRLHAEQATAAYPELTAELSATYEGQGLQPLAWQPDASWTTALELSLRERADYERFFLQGCGTALSFTDEGFHIRTPDFQTSAQLGGVGAVNKFDTSKDMSRLYLWSRQVFEGDLHVSLYFRINSPGGLALLMTQASGMQREDFLDDYALRVNGSMATVFGEDVRNYHWEYFRQMCDTRNDRVTHGLMKNPWYRPLGFQVEDRQWDTGRWYRLDWLQEGARLRGAIDGVTVLDATDSPRDNNGSVFTAGRIALRFMMRTDMTVRDLRVLNRPPFKSRPL